MSLFEEQRYLSFLLAHATNLSSVKGKDPVHIPEALPSHMGPGHGHCPKGHTAPNSSCGTPIVPGRWA